jgi:pimeloyl-ACP methyl ester carboxylesterase
MKTIYLVLSLLFWSVTCLAAPTKSTQRTFIKLDDGVERYVEYVKPQKGKTWIVFTNGLVYEIQRWGELDRKLVAQGYGIFHYYFRGQDLTLAREAEQSSQQPAFFKTGLESKDFADELHELLGKAGIHDKVIIVALSYGAHIAATFAQEYPASVEEVVFLAPLVVPLEKYQPQGQWLDWNLMWVKMLWGPYFYEYAYRQIYGTYLRDRVTEDRVPEHLAAIPDTYRESLYFLVRAVRDFDLKTYKFSKLAPNSVHYFVAQEDEEAAFKDQLAAFDGVDARTRGSLIWLPDSAHAIPDSAPSDAAYYLRFLIERDPRLEQGKKYKNTSQGLKAW